MKRDGLVAVLPGDGVGPEVIREGCKVLRKTSERFGLKIELREALIGCSAFEKTGHPLPPETTALCREANAILFGAVGNPAYDHLPPADRPERALLALRKTFDLYANLRPVRVFPALSDASPLKREVIEGTDLLIVRELTGGLYFGQPRGIRSEGNGRRGTNTMTYTTAEIERVARRAFELARKRRKKLVSVDKSNALETSQLWRETVTTLAREYPDVACSHLLVDSCAMQLVRAPGQFDVILTENLFGDILSDEAAMLTGSIGMLPSASLGEGTALYEPVHGSAPDIAGKDQANPLATILSVAMMLRLSLDREDAARAVERAVERTLSEGHRTADLVQEKTQPIPCSEMGDRVADKI
jgi:3-isopropylmalate dehydrogenase